VRTSTAAVACLLLATSFDVASAQQRCRVMDPTGTPLNVRTSPNGTIVGALRNGVLVSVIDRTVDGRGRPWVYIAHRASRRPIGWVFREFIACF
jgi:Bacterial SH3 domain